MGLVVALPLLAVAGGYAARLLPRHDVNYYLKLRPPEFMTAVVVIGIVALTTSAVMMALVIRWRWVVQVAIFERKSAGGAFAESTALTRGVRWKLMGVLAAVTLASLALGILGSLLGGVASSIALGLTGWSRISLAISFGGLLLLRTIISAACTLLGSWLDAGMFTSLYRRRRRAIGGEASLPGVDDLVGAGGPRWLPAAAVSGLVLFAAGGTWLALGAISEERTISIHAHRGVWTRAPENSLAAIRESITAGADYLETDVQMSRDGVLVVAHDSDFSRLGGVAKRVWDLTYEEIRAIPIGRGADPEFRDEITPTFDALLKEAKGRIKVNIELKYYGDHQPGLARKVVEAVRAHGMLDEVVVQCLEYEPLLEVRQLAPMVPIGYLLSFNARKPSRLEVDFLSVEQNRLDHPFIQSAHGRGQRVYAWTVNSADDLERLLDLGVDGVITDSTALARRTLDDYLRLPPSERALRRVRAWLAD
jgi:glycerophosphoryl diester phosphodiesterase